MKADRRGGRDNIIYDAIALSLSQDRHDRVAGLFEAAHGKSIKRKNAFKWFVRGFFERYTPEKDSTLFKRFFTIYGDEFNKKHPSVFAVFCGELGAWMLEPLSLNMKTRKNS